MNWPTVYPLRGTNGKGKVRKSRMPWGTWAAGLGTWIRAPRKQGLYDYLYQGLQLAAFYPANPDQPLWAALTSLFSPENLRCAHPSGPVHLLFPLAGMLFPCISAKLIILSPLEHKSNVIWVGPSLTSLFKIVTQSPNPRNLSFSFLQLLSPSDNFLFIYSLPPWL